MQLTRRFLLGLLPGALLASNLKPTELDEVLELPDEDFKIDEFRRVYCGEKLNGPVSVIMWTVHNANLLGYAEDLDLFRLNHIGLFRPDGRAIIDARMFSSPSWSWVRRCMGAEIIVPSGSFITIEKPSGFKSYLTYEPRR